MALTSKEGSVLTTPENLEWLFIGHGSYLRKDRKTVIHALSKYFAGVYFEGNDRKILFQV